jgi:hypothetical protein
MPAQVVEKAIDVLYAAVPRIQHDFLMRGPLRSLLPADIRAEIVYVFTQVLCRALETQEDDELSSFIEKIVWESRKLGVAPHLFLAWIDHYSRTVRGLLEDDGWTVTEPMLALARQRIERLQN